ncbi:hypothetical protein OAU08_02510 [Porticoccaceae bacterium]|nr:hypothetical protein [Porticoccaceae bacterium]
MNLPTKLIKRICLRLLIRGNSRWDGRGAGQIVRESHTTVNVHTNEEDFSRLVRATFQVGNVMDFGYEKLTNNTPDWEAFCLKISKAMGDFPSNDNINFFIERLRGRVASASLDARAVNDWVEIMNRIETQHDMILPSFSLDKKLKISAILDDVMEERIKIKANNAAIDMGISIEDLSSSLVFAFANVTYMKSRKKVDEKSSNKTTSGLECIQEILSLSDVRTVDDIAYNLKKYPDAVSERIIKRWKACQEDFIAEKLWSKIIKGTSVSVREMVIIHMGVHYRLLYKTSKITKHPFLSFGHRKDLFSMIENVRSLI